MLLRYLYAVVEGLPSGWRPPPPVVGERVECVTLTGLVILSSATSVVPPASPTTLALHHDVVASALDADGLVPFRYGTALRSNDVDDWLVRERAALDGALASVRGCVEMSVKLLRLDATLPTSGACASSLIRSSSARPSRSGAIVPRGRRGTWWPRSRSCCRAPSSPTSSRGSRRSRRVQWGWRWCRPARGPLTPSCQPSTGPRWHRRRLHRSTAPTDARGKNGRCRDRERRLLLPPLPGGRHGKARGIRGGRDDGRAARQHARGRARRLRSLCQRLAHGRDLRSRGRRRQAHRDRAHGRPRQVSAGVTHGHYRRLHADGRRRSGDRHGARPEVWLSLRRSGAAAGRGTSLWARGGAALSPRRIEAHDLRALRRRDAPPHHGAADDAARAGGARQLRVHARRRPMAAPRRPARAPRAPHRAVRAPR